jgi:hypothetical protein
MHAYETQSALRGWPPCARPCAQGSTRALAPKPAPDGCLAEAQAARPPGDRRACSSAARAARSTLDDPVVISAMLPLRFFWGEARHGRARWSLCAKEICFRNELLRCGPQLP